MILSKAASLKFAIRGGSAAEKYEEKGAAHLWASVAFAGTGKQSGLRLMRNLENHGITVRANAHRERIVLSSSSDASAADFAVSSIAESILSPPRDNYVITENLRIAEHDRQQLATTPRLQITEVTYCILYSPRNSFRCFMKRPMVSGLPSVPQSTLMIMWISKLLASIATGCLPQKTL